MQYNVSGIRPEPALAKAIRSEIEAGRNLTKRGTNGQRESNTRSRVLKMTWITKRSAPDRPVSAIQLACEKFHKLLPFAANEAPCVGRGKG
jgi:hypothetical protein